MHDVFISHSSIDANIANAVCHKMEKNGIRCWIAPRDVNPGDDWASSITNAIKSSKVFVLIFSDNSNNSGQVSKELTLAINYHLMITPFKITKNKPSGSLEYLLSDIHWLDAIDKPMDMSIEHLKNVVSLYLQSDDIKDFTARREEEDIIFDSKIKRRKKIVHLRNIILGLCGLALVAFSIFAFRGLLLGQGNSNGCKATLYLMRYHDVDSACHTHIYSDSLLKCFRYEKDYNEQGEYCIYPVSDHIAFDDGQTVVASHFQTDSVPSYQFPSPVIQLRLNNQRRKTLTTGEAILEITDFHRDDRPAFQFNVSDQGLLIANINHTGKESAELLYSSLIPGESFLRFKKKNVLTLDSPVQKVSLNDRTDSIIGELDVANYGKYGFVYGRTKNHVPQEITKEEGGVTTYTLTHSSHQEIPLRDFNRELKGNEIDLGVFFKVSSSINAVFRMRLRIKINGEKDYLYSNYVQVRMIGTPDK